MLHRIGKERRERAVARRNKEPPMSHRLSEANHRKEQSITVAPLHDLRTKMATRAH
ncbi:predicted protein [Arabidopsis lyrata subsp. lyrata]|uniref:Predicted protein n=1 Tax=Arabidopsis lyrata subsp. lyrata TaxID=81972 RepID=D7KMZ0_ARALL|nr:predicted protein [Arabidopsis lyrata subsp. lyrata]